MIDGTIAIVAAPGAQATVRAAGKKGVRSLAEACNGGFKIILALQAVRDFGEYKPLRAGISKRLRNMREKCLRWGWEERAADMAQYALSAFIDEAIVSSEWAHRHEWEENSLTSEFFDDFNSGDGFFRNLEELLKGSQPREILEVYYFCLRLGYAGRFGRETADLATFRKMTREALEKLANGGLQTKSELSPHWRAPAEDLRRRSKIPPDAWIILICIAAALLIFFLTGHRIQELESTVLKKVAHFLMQGVLLAPV